MDYFSILLRWTGIWVVLEYSIFAWVQYESLFDGEREANWEHFDEVRHGVRSADIGGLAVTSGG